CARHEGYGNSPFAYW
nr:immunoglobulin heavy chain junction region [Mus musculus]